MDENTEMVTIAQDVVIPTPEKPKSRRGFASMPRERVAEIAAKGGKAAHASGTAHQFSADEAKTAGAKGGRAPHKSRGRAKVDPGSKI